MFQLDSREMMFAKQANWPDGTIVSASALASVGVSPMPRPVEEELEELELDVGVDVLVRVGSGVLVAVEVEVCVGSGVWVVEVLVDVGTGTGAALEEESELGSGLVGAPGAEVEDCPMPGRARSRLTALLAARTASAFAAAEAMSLQLLDDRHQPPDLILRMRSFAACRSKLLRMPRTLAQEQSP